MNGSQPPPENGGEKGFGYGPEGINKMPVRADGPNWNVFPWQYLPGEHTMMYGFTRRDELPLIISDCTLEEWIAKYERNQRR